MARSEKAQVALDTFLKKISRQAASSLSVCVHCGMCTDSCHYYVATGDPKMAPAYKADQVRKLYKRHVDWLGQVLPGWVGARTLETDEDLEALKEVLFGSCTMCRRCSMNCPMGVDKAMLMRIGRAALCAAGVMPQGVIDVSRAQWETGNQMSVTQEEYLETIEWLSEEHQDDVGDKNTEIPLDKKNAEVLYLVNPREVKYAPLTLLAAAKIFYAAGESWTMPSTGWDGTNFGLFSGDDALGAEMGRRAFDKALELGVKRVVVSECGHGFRATRWEAPNWAKMDLPFPIESFLETMVRYLEEGRIKLDPQVNPDPVTYHDPCNLARSSGITEEPRQMLRASILDFREMVPNRADNWCCSGGGGAMSMSEYTKRRLEVAKVKADQLRETGAKIVATACHNCVDGLSDLIKHYQLGMQVKVVSELVADALVLPVKPAGVSERGRGEKILVIDDEADVVTYLTTLFEDHGYSVVSAFNAEEGIQRIREERPDLITLDILMPGKSGLTVYHDLRTNGKDLSAIPVVMVSGVNPVNQPQFDFRKFVYERSLPHPEGFVEKPINQEHLLMAVDKILHVEATPQT